MPIVETHQPAVVRRLLGEGWMRAGGGKHDKFVKDGRAPIIVPRHRTLTQGVARSIAKAAGWL